VTTWDAAKARRGLARRILETAEGEAASYGPDAQELLRCLAAAVEADNRTALEEMTTNVLLVAAAHELGALELEQAPRAGKARGAQAPAPPLVARLRNPWLLIGASLFLITVASMSRQCHSQRRLLEAPIALPVEGR
jgi:hypothetical protein